MGPALQALYRIGVDLPPEVQRKMLEAAVSAAAVDEKQKAELLDQIRKILDRAQNKDLARMGGPDDLFGFNIAPRKLSGAGVERRAGRILRSRFEHEPTIDDLPIDIEALAEFEDPDIRLVVDSSIDRGFKSQTGPTVLGVSRWSTDGMLRELVVHTDLFESECTSTRRRCNFTLAHELFHCIEHLPHMEQSCPQELRRGTVHSAEASPGFRKKWYQKKRKQKRLTTFEEWREWQANRFAGAILMPAPLVRELVAEISTDDLAPATSASHRADQIARATVDSCGGIVPLHAVFEVNPQAMAIRLMTLKLVEWDEDDTDD